MPNLTSENPYTTPLTTSPSAWAYGRQTSPTETVTRGVRQLFAGQRRGDAEDPDGYVATVAAILAYYAPSVVEAVTHPVHGLQTQQDWLPKPAELKRACEAEAARQAARRAVANPKLPPPPPERTPEEIERAMARYREIRAGVVGAALVEQAKCERVKGRVEAPDTPKVELAERLEALKAQPTPPLSDQARKALGLAEATSEAA